MNLQESIRRILREEVNESTFFIRRVDMSLMDKEFFENLNIITDVYLRKYIDGIDFNFETFEDHVIYYFMDGYYNDLTNGGENDYPVDEVYKFLLNHFHKKIKDRYDTFFGRNINDSENIIREESGLSPRFLRRVPMEKLEGSFGHALKLATKKYYRYQPVLNDDYKLHWFTKEVVELLLDSVSHLMYPTIKGSWYDEEFSKVKEHFKDRITEWWETLD